MKLEKKRLYNFNGESTVWVYTFRSRTLNGIEAGVAVILSNAMLEEPKGSPARKYAASKLLDTKRQLRKAIDGHNKKTLAGKTEEEQNVQWSQKSLFTRTWYGGTRRAQRHRRDVSLACHPT